MIRTVLSDTQWDRIKDLVPGKESDRGVTGRDNRLFVEGVLWVARTGAPWRDLPEQVGSWNSTFRRFSRWSKAGVWESLFKALADDPDLLVTVPQIMGTPLELRTNTASNLAESGSFNRALIKDSALSFKRIMR